MFHVYNACKGKGAVLSVELETGTLPCTVGGTGLLALSGQEPRDAQL